MSTDYRKDDYGKSFNESHRLYGFGGKGKQTVTLQSYIGHLGQREVVFLGRGKDFTPSDRELKSFLFEAIKKMPTFDRLFKQLEDLDVAKGSGYGQQVEDLVGSREGLQLQAPVRLEEPIVPEASVGRVDEGVNLMEQPASGLPENAATHVPEQIQILPESRRIYQNIQFDFEDGQIVGAKAIDDTGKIIAKAGAEELKQMNSELQKYAANLFGTKLNPLEKTAVVAPEIPKNLVKISTALSSLSLNNAKPTGEKEKALLEHLQNFSKLSAEKMKAAAAELQEEHRENVNETRSKESILHQATVANLEKIDALCRELGWRENVTPPESFEVLADRFLQFLKQKLNIP